MTTPFDSGVGGEIANEQAAAGFGSADPVEAIQAVCSPDMSQAVAAAVRSWLVWPAHTLRRPDLFLAGFLHDLLL